MPRRRWLLAILLIAGVGGASNLIHQRLHGSNHRLIDDFRSKLHPNQTNSLLQAVSGERGQALRKAEFIGYHLTNQGSNDPTTIELKRFWARVAARTNGKLNMSVIGRDGDLAGADNEAILETSLGRFDAITANGPIFSDIIPQVANIMTLLFAYDSSDEGLALVSDPTFQAVLAEAGQPFNLVFLPGFSLNSGMRVVTTSAHRTIRTPEDLKGFRLRIPPSKPLAQQLKALSIQPTPTPITRLIDSLHSGAIDGQENPPSFIPSFQVHHVHDQVIVTNHLWTGFLTAINSSTWNSWPKPWQKIVLSELRTLQTRQWAEQERRNQSTLADAQRRHGMTVIHPQLGAVQRNKAFGAARERIVASLDQRLQPLAKRLIQGDLSKP